MISSLFLLPCTKSRTYQHEELPQDAGPPRLLAVKEHLQPVFVQNLRTGRVYLVKRLREQVLSTQHYLVG
jgi:hypothetical protein